MSALGMHPTFTTLDAYKQWLVVWRKLYKQLSAEIRQEKLKTKELQRAGASAAATSQSSLTHKRIMAAKMMTLRTDATARWKRILAMKKQIEEQNAQFPLEIGKVPTIDFHFNKGSIEFEFLPSWIVKAKGKTYYLNHVSFINVTYDTKEMAEGSTRGLLRLKHHHLTLNADGTATIEKKVESDVQEAA